MGPHQSTLGPAIAADEFYAQRDDRVLLDHPLGQSPPALPGPRVVAINAHGWIALLQAEADEEFSLTPPGIDFDVAPAAIVMSACIAAARIFTEAFEERDWPKRVAIALDSGAA